MIFDVLKNMHCYYAVHPLLPMVSEFIASHELPAFDSGKVAIGRGVSLIIDEYTPQPVEKKRPEYHEKYIDVQLVLSGVERIGYTNRKRCTLVEEYNQEKDVAFVSGSLSFCTMNAGDFMLLFPHDVHLPGVCVISEPAVVKKAVFKIPVALC